MGISYGKTSEHAGPVCLETSRLELDFVLRQFTVLCFDSSLRLFMPLRVGWVGARFPPRYLVNEVFRYVDYDSGNKLAKIKHCNKGECWSRVGKLNN